MELSISKKITLFFLLGALVSYIFQSVLDNFGFGTTPFFFTGLAFMASFFIRSEKTANIWLLNIFVIIGLVSILLSAFLIESYQLSVGLIAFLVVYINLVTWLLFLRKLNKSELEITLKLFTKALIVLGCLLSISGIFQTFVDRSIFGFASNDLYSDEEAMSSGNYVPRATGLMGSAQNYGFLVGVVFAISLVFPIKRTIIRIGVLIILLFGIVVSGSRSSSMCFVVAVVLLFALWVDKVKVNRALLAIGFLLAAIVISFSCLAGGIDILNDRTFSRLSNFDMSNTFAIYNEVLKNLTFDQVLVGNGLGSNVWTVYQFLGADSYFQVYGESYSSVESYMLSLLVQCGISAPIVFCCFYFKSLFQAIGFSRICLMFLLCLAVNIVFTPSFSGMAVSFISWPFILAPLIGKELSDKYKKIATVFSEENERI